MVLLTILGAAALGLLLGLTWRGFIMIGDRRELGVLSERLIAEHRMSVATNQAIARMRRIAMERFGASGE